MIDFSKIKISEETVGSFGDIQLKGGIVLTHARILLGESSEKNKEMARAQIKRELFNELYGDLIEPINELKNLVKEYLLEKTEKGYSYHPHFLNNKEVENLILKIDKLLTIPK